MQTSHNPERRRFMRTVGLGTAAAGAAAAVGHVTLANAETPTTKRDDKESVNYRETDHIRAFYATLRD
ncbi:twin-arginine translocation signal domain-containing protein [Vreelandella massiliensis]|uniref:twin-arginine translocation signal domain-containing protein n=1 Tax=Vreelandella massiliensis TaxID=1816686 RepID=UPI00096AA74A|nr:twin-arginine translocation signal domain-containing protein [Halomonas massiliensis]MYL24719.1 twin-arginine translocation signal domain-containing protein [Halomonas alkaliantarctica]